MRDLASPQINQQGLLTPLILEFGNLDYLQIKNKMADIQKFGIYLEEFGQDTFILRSYPTWLGRDVEQSVRRILDSFINVDQGSNASLIKRIAAQEAQKKTSWSPKINNC